MLIFMPILFILIAAISGVTILYLIILGMAPGVKPLEFTGFFLYGPGPGFFLLIGWLVFALILRIFAWVLKNNRQSRKSLLLARISWAVLLLLLFIEAVMVADFWELL
jgi:hypothetical protein